MILVLLEPGRISGWDPVKVRGGPCWPGPDARPRLLDRPQWPLCREYKKKKKWKIVMKFLFPEDYVWSESHEAAEYTNWREHEPDNRRGQVTALKISLLKFQSDIILGLCGKGEWSHLGWQELRQTGRMGDQLPCSLWKTRRREIILLRSGKRTNKVLQII